MKAFSSFAFSGPLWICEECHIALEPVEGFKLRHPDDTPSKRSGLLKHMSLGRILNEGRQCRFAGKVYHDPKLMSLQEAE